MASMITDLIRQYDEALPHADPRTKDWLLVNNTPVYVWALTAIYMLIVFLGPTIMKNRRPYDLSAFLVVYNLGLVALSAYMLIEIILSTWNAGYSYICTPYSKKSWDNPKELRVAKVLWWYFFSKAIELLDTVLMVLRKKNNQITFLHWFHHISMLNIWWWVMMFIPGGQSIFGSSLNCSVHVVMYAYYGLSAIPSLRGKLWFKNYITQFQLTQFCVTLAHSIHSIYKPCDFPKWGEWLLVWYMVAMLILFSNFYIRTYMLKRQKARDAKNGVSHKNGFVTNGNSVSTNGVSTNGVLSNGDASNGHVKKRKV
ncbi:unnamed protein product [Owenia fusiformis]|uniref:Elongation of very long chain fatty acids protein n=1 Tax=Owenia fusiformis TaxID=6347 RepID=A0A8J1U8G7_OWEFU|nr:unnamed protein product [Owenia fusiformis]